MAIDVYVAQHDPLAAERLLVRIGKTISRLKDFLRSGRPGSAKGSFELPVPGLPYIVVYRIGARHVEILAVFHAARHPSVRSR